jgi:hypothetical protein
MGPTFGQWASTVDEMDAITRRSNEKNKIIEQWQAYAKKLEKMVEELNDMYRDKSGAADGQAELKKLALKEVERLDPGNKLLDPMYRKEIYDRVHEQTIKEMLEKR